MQMMRLQLFRLFQFIQTAPILNWKSLLWSIFFLWSSLTHAHQVEVLAGGRSYPLGGSADVRGKYDVLLWDRRSDGPSWKYGFFQPQATLSARGMIEGALSFYPVSFIELSGGLSSTERFVTLDHLGCDELVCKGNVRRERFSFRFAGGSGDWLFILSASRVWMSHKDASRPLYDESEVLKVRPGGDLLEGRSLLIGKKFDKDILGLFLRETKLESTGAGNESQLLVYRFPWETYVVSVGAGRYASDFTAAGFVANLIISWSWGQSLALF
jgi:hypothetical protein